MGIHRGTNKGETSSLVFKSSLICREESRLKRGRLENNYHFQTKDNKGVDFNSGLYKYFVIELVEFIDRLYIMDKGDRDALI